MKNLGLKAALKVIDGNLSELARICGVSREATRKWHRIPAEKVLLVESATGVSRHKLRPDIYPPDKMNGVQL